MADKIFEDLVKKIGASSFLDNKLVVKISDEKLTILRRKSDKLCMSVEDLMRVYLVNTTAFDKSYFEGKKPSRKTSKIEVKTSENISEGDVNEQ